LEQNDSLPDFAPLLKGPFGDSACGYQSAVLQLFPLLGGHTELKGYLHVTIMRPFFYPEGPYVFASVSFITFVDATKVYKGIFRRKNYGQSNPLVNFYNLLSLGVA
jgi:hypothetical protein